jgi:hypothetical protein
VFPPEVLGLRSRSLLLVPACSLPRLLFVPDDGDMCSLQKYSTLGPEAGRLLLLAACLAYSSYLMTETRVPPKLLGVSTQKTLLFKKKTVIAIAFVTVFSVLHCFYIHAFGSVSRIQCNFYCAYKVNPFLDVACVL